MRGGGKGSNATVTRCTITGNSSIGSGGGIGIDYSLRSRSRLKVVSSTIRGNAAAFGGGGISLSGKLRLIDSSVDDNSAVFGGGGIAAGYLIVSDSTISRNATLGGDGGVTGGGGLYTLFDVTARNSTISGNSTTSGVNPSSTTGLGGGLFAEGRVLLEHVTVANNTSDSRGGGIFASRVTLKASLIGDNSAPIASDCNSGHVRALGVNLIEDTTSCPVNPSGEGVVINADPMLGALRDNGGTTETQALVAGSPAISVVTTAALCKAPDQRGVTRAVPCDLGSYEAP